MITNQDKVKKLIELRATAKLGGGEKRIESQHKKGNKQPVNVSKCYWTTAASKNLTCSSPTGVQTSAWRKPNS